jgi:hypothetical protein
MQIEEAVRQYGGQHVLRVNPDHLEAVTQRENIQRAWERTMSKGRQRLSERKILRILIKQGAIIPCQICKIPFTIDDVPHIDRDHYRAKHTFPDENLREWEDLDNQRYVHGLTDPQHSCHRTKTDGMPHNRAGSDKHMAAKGKRLRGEIKQKPKAKIRSTNTLTKEHRDKVRARYAER